MAWAETSRVKTVFGNKKVVIVNGTVGNGDTTAEIVAGMNRIDAIFPQFKDLADKTIQSSNSGGTVTLTYTDPTATKIVQVLIIGS